MENSRKINANSQNRGHFIASVFRKVVEQEFDCQLLVDGFAIPCHRIILSAASTVFWNHFNNRNAEKLILLVGIKYRDIRDILKFIYTGSMTVEESRIPALEVASKILGVVVTFPPIPTTSDQTLAAVGSATGSNQMTIKPAKIFNIGSMNFRRPDDWITKPATSQAPFSNISSTTKVINLSGCDVQGEKQSQQATSVTEETPNISVQENRAADNDEQMQEEEEETQNDEELIEGEEEIERSDSISQETNNVKSVQVKSNNLRKLINEIKIRRIESLNKPTSPENVSVTKRGRRFSMYRPDFLRPLRRLSLPAMQNKPRPTKCNKSKKAVAKQNNCQYCNRPFVKVDRHELTCFSNPNRIQFECPVCKVIFDRKLNLDRHLTTFHQRIIENNHQISSITKVRSENAINLQQTTLKQYSPANYYVQKSLASNANSQTKSQS